MTVSRKIKGASRNPGEHDLGTGVGMLRLWAYPFFVAMLPAPSALTAAYFPLGESRQSRSLLHTALRYAPGPLPPAPSGATRPTTCFAKSTARVLRLRPKGAAHQPPPDTYAQPPEVAKLRAAPVLTYLRNLTLAEPGCHRGKSRFKVLLFMHASSGAADCDFRRLSGGACRGRCAAPSAKPKNASRRLGAASRRPRGPGGCRSEGTRSAA